AAVRPELRILHVEGADALVVEIDELEIVELLQDVVTGIEQDVRARVPADRLEKTLEARAVVQVFARVQLEAQVAARLVRGIEQRAPAARELREAFLDEPGRTLRPGINGVPQQCARECRLRLEPESLTRARREAHLVAGPLRARREIRADFA